VSSNASAAIVICLLVFGLVAVIWQARRALCRASEQVDHILDADRTGHIPAAPDNEPGTNLADHDECELLWSVPAHTPRDPDFDAGCDRLLNAIHEHRKENPL
jgi:hypothetical protein